MPDLTEAVNLFMALYKAYREIQLAENAYRAAQCAVQEAETAYYNAMEAAGATEEDRKQHMVNMIKAGVEYDF
jgi:hypothetical protein